MATKLANVFGIIFIIVGLVGFIGGLGIVGEGGIFHTDMTHDVVHLILGIVLLFVGLKAQSKAAVVLMVIGVVYLLVALLGFIGTNPVLGFIHVNTADNYLHLVLGLVLLIGGIKGKNSGGSSMGSMMTPPSMQNPM
jgi:hypothetical protein